jgi:hypothetical protein
MRTRLPILAAVAAVALSAGAGHAAAPKPQIVDAAGDAVGMQGTTDITSAVWSTTGDTVVTKVRGKKVTTYTPKKLVATLNLAAAPTANPPLAYEVSADVAGCGEVRFTYTPGTAFGSVLGDSSLWLDCGSEPDETGSTLTLIPGIETKLGPKSIAWTVSIKTLPKEVRVGSKWAGFRAAVDVVEPVAGLYGTNLLGTPVDEGVGNGTWVLK